MQSAPPPAQQPSKRRVRSVTDRKKHAGWRHCPRCGIHVSTNGRNYYHHMYKCDRVFFAHLLAQVDYNRPNRASQRSTRSRQPRTTSSSAFRCLPLQPSTQTQPVPELSSSFSRSHSLPHFQTPNILTASASVSGPTSASAPPPAPFMHSSSPVAQHLEEMPRLPPLSSPSSNPASEPASLLLPADSSSFARGNTVRVQLSEMQRVVFLQQLCFLRIYDRTVDAACARVESDVGPINLVGRALFDAVRLAKHSKSSQNVSKQTLQATPKSPPSPSKSYPLCPQPHAKFYESPPSPRPVPSRSVAAAMAISSVINN